MMKYRLLFFLLLSNISSIAFGQHQRPQVNVSEEDLHRFKENGYLRYSDLGAKGDGETDDIDAIVAAHALANREGLAVKADEGATYYIGGKALTAVIQTDTDFGTAEFIIDDTEVEDRMKHVFLVSSSLRPVDIRGISSLKKNQEKINVPLPGPSLITVTDTTVKRYIRFGPNENDGASQTDIFVVDKEGNVDMNAPIIWDFDQISDITAIPIDQTRLTIKGGKFTTIANQAESKYTYYARGIAIRRSNVLLDGLEHRIVGEGEHGAPYGGFLNFRDCSNVTVRNTTLTGHKTYRTIGSAGVPVSMGSYDISISRGINISFENCDQTNDINDRTYWGIMGSNFCKNLILDHCTFSRFDAHMGVANATVRNSTLGHMGINAIGSGTFLVENSTINGNTLINLRPDYGSTWQGEFIIRNCVFVPSGGRTASPVLIGGSNSGQHNFGYTTYMPRRVIIENLYIDDSNHPEDYDGPAIFSNFNPQMTSDSYKEKYSYVRTEEVILKNVTTESGKELRVCDNPFLLKDVKIRPAVVTAQTVSGVGFQMISISDPVSRDSMPGYVFYPSAEPDSVTWVGPYALAAAANLPALPGVKPLVVISHGSGGSMLGHHDMAAYLARHGFVVATLAHPKDNYQDISGNGKASVMGGRPIQVSAVINMLLEDPQWKDLIDKDRIGVAGFSNGGYTGLLLVGAVPRFDRLIGYCQRYPEDKAICNLVNSSPEPSVVKERVDALQQTYTKWGKTDDERVKSAFIMAPQSIMFDSAGLAVINRPVFLYYSQNDLVLLPQENAARIAEMIPSLVDIKMVPRAGHYVFLAPCSPALSEDVPNICTDPPGVDRAKIHAQINADALDFFRKTLSGSVD